jgi:hypothetical protein
MDHLVWRRRLCPVGGASIVRRGEAVTVATVSTSRRARLRRGLAFLAIVWGVAATFVLFERLALSGVNLLESSPALLGDAMLSPATTGATSCTAAATDTDRPAADGDAVRAAGVHAWQLGLAVGIDAAARQRTTIGAAALQRSLQGIAAAAGQLQVAPPRPFVPEHVLNAHREFVTFVEADTAETAHQIATRYATRICLQYKLGAYWGYSAMNRPVLRGERATHALEIRYYAQKVGLPAPLWQPMFEPSPERSADQTITDTDALTAAVTRFFSSQ